VQGLAGWPASSPAAVNAWLLLVTTKPPTWRDPLMPWVEHAPTVGEANEGFFYPDPLGFWAEIRRWSVELFRLVHPGWGMAQALALTSLLPVADDPSRLTRVMTLSRPHVVLFLDESSWEGSGFDVRGAVAHHIADPHRPGQVYEGFWGRLAEGQAVGKAPQHPTTHNLYRADDMNGFLRAAPVGALAPP